MPPDDDDGWAEHKLLILDKLDVVETWLSNLSRKMDQLRVDVAVLKVKAGIWGALAGLVAVGIPLLFWMLSRIGKEN